jgi:hypothetical protein
MNFSTFFKFGSFALVPVLLATVGCAGTSDGAASSDDQALTASSHEGTFCGGFAGITCSAGLECHLSSNHPDASGVCQKVSGEGEICGEDVAIQRTCAKGLSCVFSAGGPISEHQPGTCVKVVAIDGNWGADTATMTITDGKATIEFGCGAATIDELVATSASTFSGTGTKTAGTGIQFPPGFGPKPEAATFEASVSGHDMKLTMTVGGETTDLDFTKNRKVDLFHCL